MKHPSNFWKTLDIPLINCEASLTSTWSVNCVLTVLTTPEAATAQGHNPARPARSAPTGETFKIKDTKLLFQ